MHPLVDRKVFDNPYIDIEQAGICQHVAGSVAIRADSVGGEKRSIEILIHQLTVRTVAEDGLADVAARQIGAVAAHATEGVIYATVDGETEPVLPNIDPGDLPTVGEQGSPSLDSRTLIVLRFGPSVIGKHGETFADAFFEVVELSIPSTRAYASAADGQPRSVAKKVLGKLYARGPVKKS